MFIYVLYHSTIWIKKLFSHSWYLVSSREFFLQAIRCLHRVERSLPFWFGHIDLTCSEFLNSKVTTDRRTPYVSSNFNYSVQKSRPIQEIVFECFRSTTLHFLRLFVDQHMLVYLIRIDDIVSSYLRTNWTASLSWLRTCIPICFSHLPKIKLFLLRPKRQTDSTIYLQQYILLPPYINLHSLP